MASSLDTARATIEARIVSLWGVRTTVAWPDRPFTPPASGGWIQPDIVWGDGFPLTMGTSPLNLLVGVLTINVYDEPAGGEGNLIRLCDYAREMFEDYEGGGLMFGVCEGPRSVLGGEPRYRQRALSFPFQMTETV